MNPSAAANSPLVLCVDDEFIGLEVRKRLLEHAGYRVLTANDGPSALELFREQPVSAVVLDYAMPGMTGDEVAGHMRQVKPDIPIVLLTAYVKLPAPVSAPVDLFMTKGEGALALIERLGEILETKRPTN